MRGCVKNVLERARCCIRDEGGPFAVGFEEQAANDRKLLLPNGGGGERYGKSATAIASRVD